MGQSSSSTTAEIVAVGRGRHRLIGHRPWVFDDPYALSLVGPRWRAIEQTMVALFPPAVMTEATASLLARARYTEDRLATGAFEQYVILGAGLDSFAWRRPDLLRSITVFEVDEPAMQQRKHERAVELALSDHDNHVFAPIDFEEQGLGDALDAAGFNWRASTLFSWLGVTMYLTVDAIEATLRCVTRCTPGSEIVLTYAQTEPFRDETGNRFVEVFSQVAAAGGEPIQTLLAPTDAELLVQRCHLAVVDHPGQSTIRDSYFTGRSDGLEPGTVERLLTAAVP